MPELGTLPKRDSGYVYGVDLVRFIAAASVAAFHFSWNNPGAPWLMPFGWVGVQVFFVISGLVIANSAYHATARSFAVGRFLRLYPAAWCTAAISSAALLLVPSRELFRYGIEAGFSWSGLAGSLSLLGISRNLHKTAFLTPAYWTLLVELSFYFLILLIVISRRTDHFQKLAVALTLWSAIYLAPLITNSLGLTNLGWSNLGYDWWPMTLLRHGLFFALGILIWLFKRNGVNFIGVSTMVVGLSLAAVEIGSRAHEVAPVVARAARDHQDHGRALAMEACAAFYVAFLVIVLSTYLNQRFPQSNLLRRSVRTLGLATYPFYLIHATVGGAVLVKTGDLGMPYLLAVSLALIATGVFSILIATRLEPIIREFLKRLIGPPTPKVKNAEYTAP